jgi:ubiquinone/menaquinone biosynthesis C-methylase UbiE
MRAAQSAVKQKYDREAARYDRARRGLFFDLAGKIVAEMAGPLDGRAVLDVPIGTGRMLPYLEGVPRASRYVGLDISQPMLMQARRVAWRHGAERTYRGARASLWDLPLASEQFDLVLVLRLFHLFPPETYAAALREVHRVLRPGGVAIVEMRNHHRGIALGHLRRWLDRRDPRELPHYYIRPRQLEPVFGPLRIEETRGYWFDGTQLLQRVASDTARRWNLRASSGPAKYLASELVVKAVKDG